MPTHGDVSTTPVLDLEMSICNLPSRVTSASQELHGLSCATVDTTSPPWAQTPAFHAHQAPTAHILALRHPGPAQPMLTAKLVCVGASSSHPLQVLFSHNLPAFLHPFIPAPRHADLYQDLM